MRAACVPYTVGLLKYFFAYLSPVSRRLLDSFSRKVAVASTRYRLFGPTRKRQIRRHCQAATLIALAKWLASCNRRLGCRRRGRRCRDRSTTEPRARCPKPIDPLRRAWVGHSGHQRPRHVSRSFYGHSANAVPPPRKNRSIRLSRSSAPISHSQIVSTRHPIASSAPLASASRSTFLDSFRPQYSWFDPGCFRPRGQVC